MKYQVDVEVKDMFTNRQIAQYTEQVEALTSEEAQSEALRILGEKHPDVFYGQQISVDALVHPPTNRVPYETIFTQEPGKYHVQKTVGGWTVVFISDRNTARPVDGGKVHVSRQNAYAKAKRLNKSLSQTLETVLSGADVAVYEFDGYVVAVGDRSYEGEEGYNLTVAKEALPPHINEDFNSLEEVEEYLNGTLGYTRNARAWQASEREDD